MNLIEKQNLFENRVLQLIGQQITRIEYVQIKSDDYTNINHNTHLDNVHSIDFSIIFITQLNDHYEVEWSSNFIQYNINIEINKHRWLNTGNHYDVSNEPLWNSIIHTSIKDVKVFWKKLNDIYPQSIAIYFINNQVIVISAADIMEDEIEITPGCDNLLVTNDIEIARNINMIF